MFTKECAHDDGFLLPTTYSDYLRTLAGQESLIIAAVECARICFCLSRRTAAPTFVMEGRRYLWRRLLARTTILPGLVTAVPPVPTMNFSAFCCPASTIPLHSTLYRHVIWSCEHFNSFLCCVSDSYTSRALTNDPSIEGQRTKVPFAALFVWSLLGESKCYYYDMPRVQYPGTLEEEPTERTNFVH